jgi:hypothetical protein
MVQEAHVTFSSTHNVITCACDPIRPYLYFAGQSSIGRILLFDPAPFRLMMMNTIPMMPMCLIDLLALFIDDTVSEMCIIAGHATKDDFVDNCDGVDARFDCISGIAVHPSGQWMAVSDYMNDNIRRIELC